MTSQEQSPSSNINNLYVKARNFGPINLGCLYSALTRLPSDRIMSGLEYETPDFEPQASPRCYCLPWFSNWIIDGFGTLIKNLVILVIFKSK